MAILILAAPAQAFAGQGIAAPGDQTLAPSARHTSPADALIAQGDFDAAIALYHQGLEGLRLSAGAHPASTTAQQDLWDALIAIGDAYVRKGYIYWGQARRHFQESLDLSRRLVAANPESGTLRRNVAVSLARIGDTLRGGADLADLERAQALYAESLGLFRQLAAADPAASDAQLDPARSLVKMGDMVMVHQQHARSRALLRESLTIRNRLASTDPTSASLQRGIAITLMHLGLTEKFDGDFAASRAAWTEALTIFEGLAQREPGPQSQDDLGRARALLGSLPTPPRQ